ncbi:MAG: histidine--tRNA ligase [Patescibacteria group bacterium]
MPKISKVKEKKSLKKKKTLLLQSPKGMRDILPEEQPFWEKLRKVSKDVADFYNFLRIDTPVLESAEVFERTGEATDLIEKQMYFVKTKGGDRLVLRPEGTAAIMRAYLQHGLGKISQPLKLHYFEPMFRHEQPQAGRFRQHYQIGYEIIGGENDPVYDAQIIQVVYRFIESLKIKNPIVQINSIGCRICRSAYRRKLLDFYRNKQDRICRNCKSRISANPLRLLDCKEEKCNLLKIQAPNILDGLCAVCRNHFKSVLEYLDELSLPYTLNPYLVRGLDYYNRTVFEVFVEDLGFAIASGGRYDYLAELLAGRSVYGVGGSLGAERLIEAMKMKGVAGLDRTGAKIFLVHIGSEAKKRSLSLIEEFKKEGVSVIEALGKESLKSQLLMADKKKVDLALILGQKEVFEETIIIRDMKSGAQETVPFRKAVEETKKGLK